MAAARCLLPLAGLLRPQRWLLLLLLLLVVRLLLVVVVMLPLMLVVKVFVVSLPVAGAPACSYC